MGREADCTGHFSGASCEGHLLLETSELIFRGPFRLTIPLKIATAEAKDGALHVSFSGGSAHFDLGKAADAWAKSMREPKGLIQKLGIKAGQRVAVRGAVLTPFIAELRQAGADVVDSHQASLNHLFWAVASESDLVLLAKLKRSLLPDGALWIIRPKGPAGVSERATMAAGRDAGLVDVKVVGFSDTHSAEKFVVPLANRRG